MYSLRVPVPKCTELVSARIHGWRIRHAQRSGTFLYNLRDFNSSLHEAQLYHAFTEDTSDFAACREAW